MINNTNYTNPTVARLKNEHAELSSEISLLNRELLTLKDIIRYKQKDLRKINIALIHKATRGAFLSIVKSTSKPNPLHKPKDVVLICLQGGKQSCK